MTRLNRRRFLIGSGGAALSALGPLVPISAAEAAVTPSMVRLRPEIEPVVRWIETTPREKILEVAVRRLQAGLPYRDLQAGLFLAGIRNVQPRPVGFKFHTVMVINSAHQLSLDSRPSDRLYPFFWALDYFKQSQAADERQGDWALGPVDEAALPRASRARSQLIEAMEGWDLEAADSAVTVLARSAGAAEIAETLWPYGARNSRNIGHNIIFAAHAFRTLEVIGWRHAEPVLRSLVLGILDGGAGESSAEPFETSRELAKTVREDWIAGKSDAEATLSMLAVLREATPTEAAREAAKALNAGVAPDSIFDAIHLAAAEWMLRRPGIVALHAMTSANSMHYAFRAAGSSATRLLLLLQGAAWVAWFRREFGRRRQGIPSEGPRIDALTAESEDAPSLDSIFAMIGEDRPAAARMALAYATQGGSASEFMDRGRALVFRKGNDVHDYKFAAAAFEDYYHVSPRWRPHLLAASTLNLKPPTAKDSRLREAITASLDALT